ncbi:MAG TPA: antibiotic biosynthesis monooxygenase [Dehalococcoidia bacterium]|nr:antibiotic biosynthesis monooxygenase [Dehalococcoidia bacterium]
MQFVTIRRWALKDSASEAELVEHVHERLIPAYREQPGCLELELLRTSDRGSYLAVTHWDTRASFDAWAGAGGASWRERYAGVLERWLEMMAFQAEWDAEEIASS